MYAKQLNINKFRRFNQVKLKLGHFVTCIAGQNGVGKSQILALLGNCGQLTKNKGESIQGYPFRADWAEIVKGDINHDSLGSVKNALSIDFEDLPQEIDTNYFQYSFSSSLYFRTMWQNKRINQKDIAAFLKSVTSSELRAKINKQINDANNTDIKISVPARFRIIPMKNSERKTESKLEFPTYYLGLSRLYPAGEAKKVSIIRSKLNDIQLKYFTTNYTNIFDSTDTIENLSTLSLSDTSQKHGLGIENKLYGPLGNSSGQDNLNQLIAAFASFKELKEKQGKNFIGGILLIDELDASLHPAAQNKLLNFIIKESRSIGIQTVFTTHSLSLLKYFIQKQRAQQPDSNDIELMYLTKGHGKVEIKEDPKFRWIENELLTSSGQRRKTPRIPVITEDDAATWFINQILKNFEIDTSKFDFLNLSTGWTNIITLIGHDFKYFGKYITILDADVTENEISSKIRGTGYVFHDNPVSKNLTNKDILSLPNLLPSTCDLKNEKDFRPYIELEIWEYLKSLDENANFYADELIESIPLYKRTLINEGPDSDRYTNNSYESNVKSWFNNNISIVEASMPYFISENEKTIKIFANSIIAKYNLLANDYYSQLTRLDLLK